jgi:hypothetical protein
MIHGKMREALLQDCQKKIKRLHYPPKYPTQFLLLSQGYLYRWSLDVCSEEQSVYSR